MHQAGVGAPASWGVRQGHPWVEQVEYHRAGRPPPSSASREIGQSFGRVRICALLVCPPLFFFYHPLLALWCHVDAGVCCVAKCTTQRSDVRSSDSPTMPPGLAPRAGSAAALRHEDGQVAGPPGQASRENVAPCPRNPLHPAAPCPRTLRTTLSCLSPATCRTGIVCQKQGKTDQEKT